MESRYQTLGPLKMTRNHHSIKSCPYFETAKINSCAYVQDNPEGHKAKPYYFRERNRNDISSSYKESWSNYCLKPKTQYHLSMMHKPLVAYSPDHTRSRLRKLEPISTMEAKTVHNIIGEPMSPKEQKQHFKTTYSEFFKLPRNRRVKKCTRFVKCQPN